MSERREAGIWPVDKQSLPTGARRDAPSSERGFPARRQETQAKPTAAEAKPETTRKRSRQEAKR